MELRKKYHPLFVLKNVKSLWCRPFYLHKGENNKKNSYLCGIILFELTKYNIK